MIIGDRRVDKTGVMYESAFRPYGFQSEWLDLRELMKAIVAADGSTLLDVAEIAPTVVSVSPNNYSLDPDLFDLRRGVPAIIVNNDFDAYAWVITDVLSKLGVVQTNTARSLRVANNKWMTHVAFRDAGLPLPEAALVREVGQLENAGRVLGFPLVLKELEGAQGTGVRLAHDLEQLVAQSEELELHRQPLMVEHYIECGAADKRIFAVQSTIVAGMERHANPGDFRANIALGGSGEETKISDRERTLAIKATESLGLRVVGMDLGVVHEVLPEREYLPLDSPFLIEANPLPGLAGLRAATGVDGSEAVVSLLVADSLTSERPVA